MTSVKYCDHKGNEFDSIKEVFSYWNISENLIHEMESHLGTSITGASQIKSIISWVVENKISPEIIYDACKRASLSTQNKFKYLEGIIKKYISDGVTTMTQVSNRNKEKHISSSMITNPTNTFNNFEQRIRTKEEDKELEKKLINRGITQEKLDMFEERLKAAAEAARKPKKNNISLDK